MDQKCSARFLLGKLLKSQSTITTSCSALDIALGGGIETGYITEISGESSMGKTQICFQLCVNAQLPVELGGLDAEVIFVDTEKTFSSERMIEIINTTLKEKSTKDGVDVLQGRDVNHFLSQLYVFRCIEAVELLAVVHQFFEFVKNHPKVRLIIIDSVAHAIRSEELTTKTRIMLNIVTKLRELAIHTDIGILVVNQVTTRFNNDGTSNIIPALGETWSYVPAVKILLSREGNLRIASLTKSPTRPPAEARYEITSGGIRDHASGNHLHQHLCENRHINTDSCDIKLQHISRHCLALSQHVIEQSCTDEDHAGTAQGHRDITKKREREGHDEMKNSKHLKFSYR